MLLRPANFQGKNDATQSPSFDQCAPGREHTPGVFSIWRSTPVSSGMGQAGHFPARPAGCYPRCSFFRTRQRSAKRWPWMYPPTPSNRLPVYSCAAIFRSPQTMWKPAAPRQRRMCSRATPLMTNQVADSKRRGQASSSQQSARLPDFRAVAGASSITIIAT